MSYRQGRFDLIVGGVLRTYQRWEDLPLAFDQLVRFEPDIPPPPHTPEQHAEIALWEDRLQELLRGNHASRDSRR